MGNSSALSIKMVFGLEMAITLLMLKEILMVLYLVVLQLLKLTLQIRLKGLLSQKMLYLMVNSLDMSGSEIFSIDDSSFFDKLSLKERNSYNKTVSFDQDLIESLEKEPEDLSTLTLIKQIRFLSDNKLRSGVFEVELYKRLIQPVTLIAMVLLAMLFIFGSTRDVTLGRKIFFGVALGLSFEMLSRVTSAMALSFDFSPLLSSILPSIIVMFISIILLLQKSFS